MRRPYPLLAALLLALAPAAGAQVFKWVDENGKTHYGDKPPKGQGESLNLRSAPTPASGLAASPQEQAQKLLQSYEQERQDKQKKAQEAEAQAQKQLVACNSARESLKIAQQAGCHYSRGADGSLQRDTKGSPNCKSDAERAADISRREAEIAKYCQ